MAQLMLVNPSKRKPQRKKKMATRKRRTPAQLRNDKRLGRMAKARARVKRNPVAKRKAPARKRVAVSAPSRRTGKTPTKRLVARRRRRNTVKSYFPNPSRRSGKMTIKNVVNNQIRPAAIQAGGALLLDVGYGYFGSYIPAMFNTGMLKHATKGVIAVGLGMVASNFMRNDTANKLALGAMTVTFHDAMKEAMTTFMPAIPMGEAGYFNPAPVYNSPLGYYSGDSGDGMGYYSDDSGDGFGSNQQPFDTSDI